MRTIVVIYECLHFVCCSPLAVDCGLDGTLGSFKINLNAKEVEEYLHMGRPNRE